MVVYHQADFSAKNARRHRQWKGQFMKGERLMILIMSPIRGKVSSHQMRLLVGSTSEHPIKLETRLEWDIATDPEWLAGVQWGKPRPGHPEGKVAFHIRDVLNNIERYFGDSGDRSRLRLVALIHDTLKYKVIHEGPGAREKSHGYLARKFAERYINEESVLEVIELHDEAYKASMLMTQNGNREAAERQARELIARLGGNIGLFMRFYLCDNRVGEKSTAHYEWFKGLAEKHAKGRRGDGA
jgi:hypothetical protein